MKPDTNLEKRIQNENDIKIDQLYSQIAEIKTAAIDIQEETKSSASLSETIFGGMM
jgi:hypothetical protein